MKLRNGMIFMLSCLSLCADESLNNQELVEERFEIESPAEVSDIQFETAAASKSSTKYKKGAKNAPAPAPEYSERIQVGGNYSYAWIKPKGNHKTNGSLGGIRAIYEHRPHDSIYAAAVFSWRTGTTKNSNTKRKLQDFNAQERFGYTIGKNKIGHNRLTFYSGAGVRYLAEKVSANSTSLVVDYTEFYVPVGFLYENKVNSFFAWGCDFQWMPQVFPLVRLKPLGGAQWALKDRLPNFLVEVPLTFSAYSERIVVVVTPFFESWHDGHTTAKTTTGLTLALPGNSYLFTGVNVSFGVSF